MPRYAFAVRKRFGFRTQVQHFTNVYHYQTATTPDNENDLKAHADYIVSVEKSMHSQAAWFVGVDCWQTGLGKAQNEMIFRKQYNTQGFATSIDYWDRERAFLIMWPAGKDSRGKPVWLRKWYHCNGNPFTNVDPGAWLGPHEPLPDSLRAQFGTQANKLRFVAELGREPFDLVAQSGRVTRGDAICHRFLEHHQLGDEWRG